MEDNIKISSPNAARLTSDEVFDPDENPTTVVSTHLNSGSLIINVTLLIPTGPQHSSNQRYEIAIPATSEDQQVNLLTKSYLARLSVTDNSIEDDDVEESVWGDDNSRFPNTIQETCTG